MYVQNSIRNIRNQVLTYLIFLSLKSFSLTFYIYFISAVSPPITDPGKSGNLMEKYNDQKEQTILLLEKPLWFTCMADLNQNINVGLCQNLKDGFSSISFVGIQLMQVNNERRKVEKIIISFYTLIHFVLKMVIYAVVAVEHLRLTGIV